MKRALLLSMGLIIPMVIKAEGFILEAGVDGSPSIGKFSITLTESFITTLSPDLQQYLCPDFNCTQAEKKFTSPLLYDAQTQIGRSRPHPHNGILDTLKGIRICQEGISYACDVFFPSRIKDSSFTHIPHTIEFKQGANLEQQAANIEPEEVHVQLASLEMIDHCAQTANRIRAGQAAPEQFATLGEVESLTLTGGFPAENFFNLYIEIDVDLDKDNQIDFTLLNQATTPLIFQGAVESFPLRVIYHTNVMVNEAIPLYDQNNPQGEHVAWLQMIAIGFDKELDCQSQFPSSDNEPPDDDNTTPQTPLLIKLLDFRAKQLQNQVRLSWKTSTENNSGGFYIWRAQQNQQGQYIDLTRITPVLIPAQGRRGASYYSYWDQSAIVDNTYHYALEEIELSGNSHLGEEIISITLTE